MNQKNINETVLNLELQVGEINVILASLGKHPFDEIATLINKIKTQGDAQLKEITEKEENTEE